MNFTFFIDWFGDRWDTLKSWSGMISKTWGWEVNTYAIHSLIMIDIKLQLSGDHRGLFGMVGLLGYAVDVDIYDSR